MVARWKRLSKRAAGGGEERKGRESRCSFFSKQANEAENWSTSFVCYPYLGVYSNPCTQIPVLGYPPGVLDSFCLAA